MTQQSRRHILAEAVHTATIELAIKDAMYYYPPTELAPKPTPNEISALATREQVTADTNTDQLWSAAAIDPNGKRHYGLGRTPGEATAHAWACSHWPGGTTSALIEVSPEVPDGWTFELYPPPKPRSQMPRSQTVAISAPAIFELVRLTIPDVTLDEIGDTIMQNLPYMGGPRH
jgi:hypothetical protein